MSGAPTGESASHATSDLLAKAPGAQNESISNTGGTGAGASSRNVSKMKTKSKTEPANQYFQFLKAKKLFASGSKLKMGEVKAEWKAMDEDQKAVYKEKFEVEKAGLGPNYRKNRRKAKNPVSKTKPKEKKRSKKSRKIRVQEPKKTSFVSNLSVLMNKMKSLDIEIKGTEEEVEMLTSVKLEESIKLAVSKTSLKVKSDNKSLLSEKHANMMKLHKSCNLVI